jgi:hypothetical protein
LPKIHPRGKNSANAIALFFVCRVFFTPTGISPRIMSGACFSRNQWLYFKTISVNG